MRGGIENLLVCLKHELVPVGCNAERELEGSEFVVLWVPDDLDIR